MKVECPPFLEFKPVKIALDVGRGGMVLAPEDVRSPAIAVSAAQVATCNVLQNAASPGKLVRSRLCHTGPAALG